MELKIDKYIPGELDSDAKKILAEKIRTLDPDKAYSDVLRRRVNGELQDKCTDIYFIGTVDGQFASRHWNGWGKHKDAIGNFGHFNTNEELRGHGIGRKMLAAWYEDLMSRPDKPLALFCTSAPRIAHVYLEYGFRIAVEGFNAPPLYMPLGDSPDTFREFCAQYYPPNPVLREAPADIEYRHEIDCLLKFARLDRKLGFGFAELPSFEAAFVQNRMDDIVLYFTENNHVAGWGLKTADGIQKQLDPEYE